MSNLGDLYKAGKAVLLERFFQSPVGFARKKVINQVLGRNTILILIISTNKLELCYVMKLNELHKTDPNPKQDSIIFEDTKIDEQNSLIMSIN